MIYELKLVISEKGENITKVVKETDTDPSLLFKSLEEFKLIANAAITKLLGESDKDNDVEEYSSSDCDEEEIYHNPKRKKAL